MNVCVCTVMEAHQWTRPLQGSFWGIPRHSQTNWNTNASSMFWIFLRNHTQWDEPGKAPLWANPAGILLRRSNHRMGTLFLDLWTLHPITGRVQRPRGETSFQPLVLATFFFGSLPTSLDHRWQQGHRSDNGCPSVCSHATSVTLHGLKFYLSSGSLLSPHDCSICHYQVNMNCTSV